MTSPAPLPAGRGERRAPGSSDRAGRHTLLGRAREIAKRLRAGMRGDAIEKSILLDAARMMEFSYSRAEREFLKVADVGVVGKNIYFRPTRQGSFRAEKNRLAKFLKAHLIANDQEFLWSQELVDNFRSWIACNAQPIDPNTQISNNESLVD